MTDSTRKSDHPVTGGPNTLAACTLEVFLNSEKILVYTYCFPSPGKFLEVHDALKVLWPDAVIQFQKEKKDV